MTAKRPAPTCVRLSQAERARLMREAKGKPLGTHIRLRLLGDEAPETTAQARMLGLLAQVMLLFKQLLAGTKSGTIPTSPQIEEHLAAIRADIHDMRNELLAKLNK